MYIDPDQRALIMHVMLESAMALTLLRGMHAARTVTWLCASIVLRNGSQPAKGWPEGAALLIGELEEREWPEADLDQRSRGEFAWQQNEARYTSCYLEIDARYSDSFLESRRLELSFEPSFAYLVCDLRQYLKK